MAKTPKGAAIRKLTAAGAERQFGKVLRQLVNAPPRKKRG